MIHQSEPRVRHHLAITSRGQLMLHSRMTNSTKSVKVMSQKVHTFVWNGCLVDDPINFFYMYAREQNK